MITTRVTLPVAPVRNQGASIQPGTAGGIAGRSSLSASEFMLFGASPLATGEPSVAKRVEGGDRPRSSAAPTIKVGDGKPRRAIGSRDGSRVIPDIAGALVGTLDFGLDPQVVFDRCHAFDHNSMNIEFEDNQVSGDPVATLKGKGHGIGVQDLKAGLQAIDITPDALADAADRGRDGGVAGG